MHSVRDNINISARRKLAHAGCLINTGGDADQHIQSLNIKTPSPPIAMNPSGGNQQKAIPAAGCRKMKRDPAWMVS